MKVEISGHNRLVVSEVSEGATFIHKGALYIKVFSYMADYKPMLNQFNSGGYVPAVRLSTGELDLIGKLTEVEPIECCITEYKSEVNNNA